MCRVYCGWNDQVHSTCSHHLLDDVGKECRKYRRLCGFCTSLGGHCSEHSIKRWLLSVCTVHYCEDAPSARENESQWFQCIIAVIVRLDMQVLVSLQIQTISKFCLVPTIDVTTLICWGEIHMHICTQNMPIFSITGPQCPGSCCRVMDRESFLQVGLW